MAQPEEQQFLVEIEMRVKKKLIVSPKQPWGLTRVAQYAEDECLKSTGTANSELEGSASVSRILIEVLPGGEEESNDEIQN